MVETRATRVLVVEDEPHISRLLEYNLSRVGYDVRVAYDGDQALSEIESRRPDIVLLDLMLPTVSGMEVLKTVRADRSLDGMKIMVLSAHSMGDVRAEVLALGADQHASKPIAPSTLLETMATLDRGPATPVSGG